MLKVTQLARGRAGLKKLVHASFRVQALSPEAVHVWVQRHYSLKEMARV